MEQISEVAPLLGQRNENYFSLKIVASTRLVLQAVWFLTWAWGQIPDKKIANKYDDNWLQASTYCGMLAFVMDAAYLTLTETSFYRRAQTIFSGEKLPTEVSGQTIITDKQRLKEFEQLRQYNVNLPNRCYLGVRPFVAILYFTKLVPNIYIFFDALAFGSLAAALRILCVNQNAAQNVIDDGLDNVVGFKEGAIKNHFQQKYFESKIELMMSVWGLGWTIVWHYESSPAGCCFILTNIMQLIWVNWPEPEPEHSTIDFMSTPHRTA